MSLNAVYTEVGDETTEKNPGEWLMCQNAFIRKVLVMRRQINTEVGYEIADIYLGNILCVKMP
jgi:hypothetical protein